MATHVVTKALSSYWKLCYCPSSIIYHVRGIQYVRFYSLKHKMTKQERHELAEYRRNVTELRKQFKQEWADKEKMKEEETSVETAEFVALERHKEKTALEENKREIERMDKWREEKMAKVQLIKEERHKKGEITRKMKESEQLEEKTTEVQKFINASTDFITLENLDAKLEEAVKTEINVNFALKVSGQKIF